MHPKYTSGHSGRGNWFPLKLSIIMKRQHWHKHWLCLNQTAVRRTNRSDILLIKQWLQALALDCFFAVLTAIPALGAEQVSFSSELGEFSISVASLEAYAREGKKDSELAFYAQHMKPQEFTQLRKILQYRVKLSLVKIAQLFYSSIGENFLRYLGDLIQTDARQNGFYAIRSALILAAADPQGLTLLNVLKKFPSRTIHIDSALAFKFVGVFDKLLDQTNKATALIEQQSRIEASAEPPVNPAQHLNLQQPGFVVWQKETLTFEWH